MALGDPDAPMFMLNAALTPPSASPSTSSVDPPPRSTTNCGDATDRTRVDASCCAPSLVKPSEARLFVAPTNDRSASSSPVTTSGSTPSLARIPAMNSSRLPASRLADVATNRIRSTPNSRQSAAYRSTTANVRCSASGANPPVASTPWPNRTTSMRRSISRAPSSSISATSKRSEFVPQSKAATRVMLHTLPCRVTAWQLRAPRGRE